MPTATTTILGTVYQGRPGMGTLAFDIWKLEQDGKPGQARHIFNVENLVRSRAGREPVDLASDMSTLPMEGGFCFPAIPSGGKR